MNSNVKLYLDRLVSEIKVLSDDLKEDSSFMKRINFYKKCMFVLGEVIPFIDGDNYGSGAFIDKQRELSVKESNYRLFKKLSEFDGVNLLSLNGKDLDALINFLNSYDLVLRDSIGVSADYTIGLELEFEFEFIKSFSYLKEFISTNFSNWEVKSDNSLRNGAEIISPVSSDTREFWENLKLICLKLDKYMNVGVKSGGHVHIGAHTLGDNIENWKKFLLLWKTYENIIYRFGYNEFLGPRPTVSQYAYPMALEFDKVLDTNCDNLSDMISLLNKEKYQGVNFMHVDLDNISDKGYLNTIEFRCPNGALDAVILQNNVNLFIKMIEYAKSSEFNYEVVNRRFNINNLYNSYGNLDYYGLINLEQALEFSDLIFSNMKDKLYFLKQYLKNMQEVNKQSYVIGKKLTK